MSLEAKKQLREVLVATGTSFFPVSLPLSLPLLLFRIGNVQTTARKRKSLTATKARESNSRKEKRFVDYRVEHSLFYARSKLMLGFEEREADEEAEEEDGGAWWIALLMLMNWIEFVNNSSDLLPHRI
jgi:hypothetical protein